MVSFEEISLSSEEENIFLMSRWNILQVSVRLLLFMILFNDRVSPFEICLNKVLMIVCTEVNYYHCAGDFVSNIFFNEVG